MSNDLTRRFTEEQMTLIIQRASELQSTRDAKSVTLDDIQSIAREVGIDPDYIDAAAQSVMLERANAAGAAAGAGGNSHVVEFTLPGRAGAADLGVIINAVRRAAGASGTSQSVLDGVEWRWGSQSEVEDLRVSLTPAADGTHVRVQYDGSGAAMLGWIVSIGPGLLGAGIAFNGLPVPWAVAATGGLLAGIGGLTAFWKRALARRGDRLTKAVTQAIRDEASRLRLPPAGPGPER
jgi:hypothetical protein